MVFKAFGQGERIPVDFIFSHNGNYEIRVDRDSLYQKNKILLHEGTHIIEIWIPGLKMINDTIYVGSDVFNRHSYMVEVSKEHAVQKLATKNWKIAKRKKLAPLIVMDATFGVTALICFEKGWRLHRELFRLKNTHDNNFTSTLTNSNYISTFNEKKLSYERWRIAYYSFLGLTTITTTITLIKNSRYKHKLPKPHNASLISPFSKRDYSLSLVVTPASLGLKLTF